MRFFHLPYLWLTLFFTRSLPVTLHAQQLALDVYQARVTLQTGEHFRGLLDNVTETELYLTNARGHPLRDPITLHQIRKIVLRRNDKKSALITGAIIGGLAAGYVSNQSLQKNQPSSPISYGLTLTFAVAGGAAGGLLVGSAAGNLTRRVIRPQNVVNPETSLFRQLEPFSLRYQRGFIR